MFCHLFLERSSFVLVSVRAYKQRKTKQNKPCTGTEGLLTIFAISTNEHVALISENGVFSFNSHNIMVQHFAVFFFFFFFFFLNSK